MNTTRVKLNSKLIFLCGAKSARPSSTSVCDKQIPEPRKLPIIGTMLSLLAAGSAPKLHQYIDNRHKELGPIFKEKIGPINCVFLSDPEGIRTIFANEGKYPAHVLPDAWLVYNKKHGNSRGIFFMDGEEWLRYRRIMNRMMLKGNLTWIETACEPVAEDLAQEFRSETTNTHYPDLEKALYAWSLKTLVSILIGPSTYHEWERHLKEKIIRLSEANQQIFLTTSKLTLISNELTCKFNIPSWRRFEKAVADALSGSSQLVKELLAKYAQKDGLLHKMRLEGLDDDQIIRIVTDLVIAAGDTTSYSLEWTLYCLGKHPEIQNKIRADLQQNKSTLIRHSIKESMRLYPIAPFLSRFLPEPVKVLGYTVPANTLVVMSVYTSGRDEKYFDYPERFLPERWTRSECSNMPMMQTASLPFAMGSRSCIGRRIAEIQMKVTLAHILEKYRIVVRNKRDVNYTLKMVGVPSESIQLTFAPI